MKSSRISILLIPFAVAAWVWLSPLSFVPVPWPDDSAFYFVAHELFKWPPRWVMLPQAPFEPTYRIMNFITMPLYPILIGIGRWIGIDGSHGIKLWPLAFWALSGSLLGLVLLRKGLHGAAVAAILLVFSFDPISRWASVLVRPESLIGFLGTALVLGLTYGFPRRFEARRFWDPFAALLAIGAYAHFNAVHLVFPVVATFITQPRRIVRIGALTSLYLSGWLLLVLTHPKLFIHQMTLQWKRLAIGNDWLSTPSKALGSLLQDMGSPEPWPSVLHWGAALLGALILGAVAVALYGAVARVIARFKPEIAVADCAELVPAGAWVLGAAWLWHTKPEVWFTYYMHASAWVFAGVAALFLWKRNQARWMAALVGGVVIPSLAIFAYTNAWQVSRLSKGTSWKWDTYHSFVDCVDERLTRLEKETGSPKPFRVWCPTFPDITIELLRRHPDWELSRTNDFHERWDVGLQHGRDVDAMVVTETLGWTERDVSAPMSEKPEITSTWMTWDGYFLVKLWREQGWKPNRHVCQKGRWQAFIFMK